MQTEIEAGLDNISLAWTTRLLQSPTAIENILAKEEKQNARPKITVTSGKDKDKLLKNGE